MSGIECIARYRDKIEEEELFFDPLDGDLGFLACYYAMPRPLHFDDFELRPSFFLRGVGMPQENCTGRGMERGNFTYEERLVVAGAILAAEIDRLHKEKSEGGAV